ncbi:MAG: MFS transporter [Arachnia propionica]|uniref:MFS transporter n=1 Tax=Arachnia propionica TaxID=1750 RepID=UPI0027048AC6|nr:MFS transporter [Arachnia propionica]
MAVTTAPTRLPAAGRAALKGGVWGNYVDQLHIFLPVTALAPALPMLAGEQAITATVSFVVMATLLGRPIGAMVFGRISDRLGRTVTTKIAIAGTAVCTLLIAAVPTHHLLGAWTMWLIIVLRFLGGAFLAGEYTSAIPLAMEWSRPRGRGLVSGLIMSMSPWAQATIAFVTLTQLTLFGLAHYGTWGWRVSFATGGIASLVMLGYYSAHVADAPVYRRHARSPDAPAGLAEILVGSWRRAFWQMFGLMTGLWFMTNVVVLLLARRLVSSLALPSDAVAMVMGWAAVAQAIFMAVAGHLSSRTGRRRFLVAWGLTAAVIAPMLWWATMHVRELVWVAVSAALLQVFTVCGYGPIGAYLCERFPTRVRATGYGTAYSLSIIVPALHPYYLPGLENRLGHDGAPMALLVLGGALVALCGALGPRLSPAELDADVETVADQRSS